VDKVRLVIFGNMHALLNEEYNLRVSIFPSLWALFSSLKILQNFSDSPSHRIFRRMHGVLNIDKNKK